MSKPLSVLLAFSRALFNARSECIMLPRSFPLMLLGSSRFTRFSPLSVIQGMMPPPESSIASMTRCAPMAGIASTTSTLRSASVLR